MGEKIPGLEQSAVVALTRADGGAQLAVAAVSADGVDWPPLERAIAQVMRGKPPHLVFRVKDLPRNEMGKVDRARLAEQLTPVLHALDRGLASRATRVE